MIKTFCDCCEQELTSINVYALDKDSDAKVARVGTKDAGSGPMLMVTTGKDGMWNKGDWCTNCVLDAVAALDRRPKAK